MRLLAILDCHREPDYMPEMLASAGEFREWPGEKWQIWSGENHRPIRGFEVLKRKRDGSAPAMLDAFRLMIERGADSLLMLENDIVFDVGAIDTLASIVIPLGLPLVSFFQPRLTSNYSGIEAVPFHVPRLGVNPRFSWNQCVLLTREACHNVLIMPESHTWTRPAYGDKLLGRVLGKIYPSYGVHWPNLVEHIGDKSSYGWDSSKWKRANAPITA